MMLLTTCENITSVWFASLIDIIETICAVGNLLLLIYFTNREWAYSKKRDALDEENTIERAKQDRQRLWYDKIVIERIVTYLLQYFDCMSSIIPVKKVQNDDEKKLLIGEIKENYRRYKCLVIPCLEIFSHKLTQDINRLLQEYYDLLTREVDKSGNVYSFDFERNINQKKAEILKKVYSYDFENNLKKVSEQ